MYKATFVFIVKSGRGLRFYEGSNQKSIRTLSEVLARSSNRHRRLEADLLVGDLYRAPRLRTEHFPVSLRQLGAVSLEPLLRGSEWTSHS